MTRTNLCGECGAGVPLAPSSPPVKKCCKYPNLMHIQHPVYECRNCRKKVRLVKVERVEARVIDDSEEARAK